MKEIYTSPHLTRKNYKAPLDEENTILNELSARSDAEADRLKRYLAMPDLTRSETSPLKSVVEMVLDLPSLKNFDIIDTPEIISPELVFDLFNFPKDHPARSRSDTYYVDPNHILRPHTSLMWKYYLDIPEVLEQLENAGIAGAVSYGKVYRKDEIDWQHSNVLHHFDGLLICKKSLKEIVQEDLENICIEVAQALWGKEMKYKFLVDHFPYTDPSLEMDIEWDGEWVEINGAGLVHPQVIKNLGLDPEIYNGWAFGFGVDRLAMLKMKIPDIRLLWSNDERVVRQLKDIRNTYQAVSKYPPVIRDISILANKEEFNLNRYYEMIRDLLGESIEEVKLTDSYENKDKLGEGNISHTFRIIYRSLDRTLTNSEVDALHKKLEEKTLSEFGAKVR